MYNALTFFFIYTLGFRIQKPFLCNFYIFFLHLITVQRKTSSVPSGRKTCRGQSRKWRSPNLQECMRCLCKYHWTKPDAAVLKEDEFRIWPFFRSYLWHIVMFCKRGNSGFISGGMEALFLTIIYCTVISILYFCHPVMNLIHKMSDFPS